MYTGKSARHETAPLPWYTVCMMKRSYIILAGAAAVALIIGGALLFLRRAASPASLPTTRVVPPIEVRIATLDTLAEGGANASTSVQAPEEKLRTLETLSKQNGPSQDTTNPAASSTDSAPDTSEKLDVLRSMRGQ